ncbi:MAG: CPBP family intramembrane metalloprotease [Verrucomicrobia bacterium]|nr:MAG: CPBP family intramembrane metalloprotease [Verrucomicrobiota bacterium]
MAMYLLLGAFGLALAFLLAGGMMRRSGVSGVLELPPPVDAGSKVRTWWVQSLDVAGLIVMSLIFMGFGVSALALGGEDQADLSAGALVLNAAMFAIFVGAVWAIVRWRVRPTDWLGLRWSAWVHLLWFGPTIVLGMWLVMGLLQVAGYMAFMEEWLGTPSMQESVELLKESKDSTVVALMALSAAVVAPLAEEIIFRGYLYPVAKKWSGKVCAVVFSALWFSACHGNVPLILPLFLLGVILALAYEKTGSIWAPIGIHFFFNSATVLIQLAIRAGWISDQVAS